jgi:fluoride ion exporter CrcB/FEX
MDGFCGCLTTVSTWVAELVGMKRKREAYAYALASVSVALGLCVVIMGSVRWSVGWEGVVCAT